MSSPLSIPSHIVSDTIGADTIVININSGAYYALSDTGANVWREVVAGREVDAGHSDHVQALIDEGLLVAEAPVSAQSVASEILFTKYTDMEDLLIADPIHEVGPDGWPQLL